MTKTERLIKATKDAVARNVRVLRIDAGLTQAVVARRAKLHLRSYQRIEAGETSPRVDGLAMLGRALRVDAATLLERRR